MISKLRYPSFLETKSVSKLLTFENTKGHEISKNCQERGDRSLISTPLFSRLE
jgi:hypothetical protein